MGLFKVWLLLAALTTAALATTWFESEEQCPFCGAAVNVMAVGSYGSYIYNWDSKYQYIYWPFTDGQTLYVCNKCSFTWFMGDDEGVAESDRNDIKAVLSAADYGSFTAYHTLPMSARLATAERVYRLLGRDDDWWGHIYRVQGYWLEAEGDAGGAAVARRKALALAEAAAAKPENAGRKKEYLFAAAAMQHYLGDDRSALATLKEAAALKIEEPSWPPENNEGFDKYLTALISEYLDKIKAGDMPGQE